jgi:hypothetical protein
VGGQVGESAEGGRELGDLGLSDEQDLSYQLQPGVPAFGLVRVVEAGRLDEVGDRLGAVVVLGRPDREPGVAVEGHLAAWEMVDEPVQQGDHVVLGEEGQQPVGDDHRRSAGGDGVQPVRVGQVGADGVGVGAGWQQLASGGDDLGEVDVVPVDGRRGGDAEHPGVEPRPEVDRDRVGVAGDEPQRHLVELLGPMGDVDDGAGAEVEPVAVIAEGPGQLAGHGVGRDGVGRAVVEGPAAQGQEHGLLDRREPRKRDGHVVVPFCGPALSWPAA